MLLQTNSYIVPKDKRAEHARLMRRFRQALSRLGCDSFEVYEQVGANWSSSQATGRFVQIMRFRDRKHQLSVQNAERSDPAAQEIIAEFCALVNYPYQVQQNLFAVGFYNSALPVAPVRVQTEGEELSVSDDGSDRAGLESEIQTDQPAEAFEESAESGSAGEEPALEPPSLHEQSQPANGEAVADGPELDIDAFAGIEDEPGSESGGHPTPPELPRR